MKKNEIYSYIYDFVSRLIEKVDETLIEHIIVFGSVVRGDFDKESDVDIFIDTQKPSAIEPVVKSVIDEFYSHSKHTWVLRGIENIIKPIVGNLDADRWSNLKKEIISNGLVIYGSYKELPENTKHCVLINYDISKLKPKDKSKFTRDLLGYRLVRKKKEYIIQGLLQKSGGTKIGKSSVLIPKQHQGELYKFFSKSKSSFEIREAWIKI